tara:strand:+ start:151 stop:591 length:441 start_codon:yes stop_codon:yes gene_type:complete
MPEARWFLAHRRHDDDTDIDDWTSQLTLALASNAGWAIVVTSGRDDYHDRATALGGWKAWGKDVACGKDWRGDARFHGVVVPIDVTEEAPVIAEVTADMVREFISQGKHAFVWCPRTEGFRAVKSVTPVKKDGWKSYGRLELMVDS